MKNGNIAILTVLMLFAMLGFLSACGPNEPARKMPAPESSATTSMKENFECTDDVRSSKKAPTGEISKYRNISKTKGIRVTTPDGDSVSVKTDGKTVVSRFEVNGQSEIPLGSPAEKNYSSVRTSVVSVLRDGTKKEYSKWKLGGGSSVRESTALYKVEGQSETALAYQIDGVDLIKSSFSVVRTVSGNVRTETVTDSERRSEKHPDGSISTHESGQSTCTFVRTDN